MFDFGPGPASLLDPGAGIGTLSAAFAERWLRETASPLSITAVEIDDLSIARVFLPVVARVI